MKKYVVLLLFVAGFVQNSVCTDVHTVWDWNYKAVTEYWDEAEYKYVNYDHVYPPLRYTFNDILPGISNKHGKLKMKKTYCIRRENHRTDSRSTDKRYDLSVKLKFKEHGPNEIDGIYNGTRGAHDLPWWLLLRCERESKPYDKMSSTFMTLDPDTIDSFFADDKKTPRIPPRFFCTKGKKAQTSCWDESEELWRSPPSLPNNKAMVRVYVINNNKDNPFTTYTFPVLYTSDLFVILNKSFRNETVVYEVPWFTRCMSSKKYEDQTAINLRVKSVTRREVFEHCNDIMRDQEDAAESNLKYNNNP